MNVMHVTQGKVFSNYLKAVCYWNIYRYVFVHIQDLTIIVNCENMVNKLHIAQNNKIVHCNNMDNLTHDPKPLEITI